MANLFRSVPIKKPPRSGFDLSHMFKFTGNAGELIPIFCEPVYPGDKARVTSDIMIRLAPMLYPVYERINVYTHFFFVPMRLIWNDWEEFITGGKNGQANIAAPTISFGDELYFTASSGRPTNAGYVANALFGNKSLMTYLGVADISDSYVDEVKQRTSSGDRVAQFFDALPLRAYLKVWNDYYRDETFSVDVFDEYENLLTGNGNTMCSQLFGLFQSFLPAMGNKPSQYCFARRAWEKDYFTSALPWSQRGGQVDIPMGNVSINSGGTLEFIPTGTPTVIRDGSSPYLSSSSSERLRSSSNSGSLVSQDTENVTLGANLKADITSHTRVGALSGSVEPATINSLRRAFRLQEYLENMARGGYRYIEQIFSHFGVKSSDSRLQRAEYLGGGVSPVVVSEVLQQSQATEESPLGNFAGHGISVQKTHQFKRFFEEHGIVIGIMSIMPKPGYFGGQSRKWTKRDRLDYYWPEFANIGEQAILNQELGLVPLVSNVPVEDGEAKNANNKTFGYTPRYSEYKFSHDRIGGDFAGSLNSWHMARFFGVTDVDSNAPVLNSEFIFQQPTTRIFANTTPTDDHYWVQIYHHSLWSRPMPKFGVPTF